MVEIPLSELTEQIRAWLHSTWEAEARAVATTLSSAPQDDLSAAKKRAGALRATRAEAGERETADALAALVWFLRESERRADVPLPPVLGPPDPFTGRLPERGGPVEGDDLELAAARACLWPLDDVPPRARSHPKRYPRPAVRRTLLVDLGLLRNPYRQQHLDIPTIAFGLGTWIIRPAEKSDAAAVGRCSALLAWLGIGGQVDPASRRPLFVHFKKAVAERLEIAGAGNPAVEPVNVLRAYARTYREIVTVGPESRVTVPQAVVRADPDRE